jgi:hypothetical protein
MKKRLGLISFLLRVEPLWPRQTGLLTKSACVCTEWPVLVADRPDQSTGGRASLGACVAADDKEARAHAGPIVMDTRWNAPNWRADTGRRTARPLTRKRRP